MKLGLELKLRFYRLLELYKHLNIFPNNFCLNLERVERVSHLMRHGRVHEGHLLSLYREFIHEYLFGDVNQLNHDFRIVALSVLIKFNGVVSELHDLNLEEAEGRLILDTEMGALLLPALDPSLVRLDYVFYLVKLIASSDFAVKRKD